MPVNAQAPRDGLARGVQRGPGEGRRCRRGYRRRTLLLIGDVQGVAGDRLRLMLSSLADDDDGDLQKPPAGVAFMSRLADKGHASSPIGAGACSLSRRARQRPSTALELIDKGFGEAL